MIKIIEIEESEKWNAAAKQCNWYDVYNLVGYTKTFTFHGNDRPVLIYYEGPTLKAMNIVLIRDLADIEGFSEIIPHGKWYDFITPYGYGGFVMDGEINEATVGLLKQEYEDYCIKHHIVSEFVRFHPIMDNVKHNKTIYECEKMGPTVTIPLDSSAEIWSNFKSENRTRVRKAMKAGVKIYWGRDEELVDAFIPLYNQTMANHDAKDFYFFNRDYYMSILEDLKYHALFFYAKYEEEIISMAIILYSNKNLHYHLSGSNPKYRQLAANNLLIYEAARWGVVNGYKNFHLGGGLGSQEDTLYRFKKSFTRESETYFSIGKKIFNQEMYDFLLAHRNQLNPNPSIPSFFPEYRS